MEKIVDEPLIDTHPVPLSHSKELKNAFEKLLWEFKATFGVANIDQKELMIEAIKEMTKKLSPSLPPLKEFYCLSCWHKLGIKDHVNKICESCNDELFK